jgi:luciferase-like monooxygenase
LKKATAAQRSSTTTPTLSIRLSVTPLSILTAPRGLGSGRVKRVMAEQRAVEVVREAVEKWEGVTTHAHRFGGVEFRLGRRELGHLHRSFADLPFPRRVRDELVRDGQARPHHVLPESGWVTVPMRTAIEVQHVIELFRKNYDRYLANQQEHHAPPPRTTSGDA